MFIEGVLFIQATVKVKAKELRGKRKEDLQKQLLELKTVSCDASKGANCFNSFKPGCEHLTLFSLYKIA